MKKQLLSTLLALCMALALLPGTAFAASSGSCGDNATWTLDSNGKLAISGTGAIDRPDNHYEDWVAVKTVEVGEGITELGVAIFEFGGSITKATLPESLTTIGGAAFYLEYTLEEVNIPSGVTEIGDGAFFGCSGLASGITLPDGLTTIGEMAFYGIPMTSITVPRSVASIGEWALGYGSLEEEDPTPGFIIYGYAGTEAERYAKTNGITFKALGETTAPAPEQTAPAQTTNAVLSPQKLTVNGANVECEKYNIGGSNYFKLRDLAYVLNGTASQFEVGFDAATSTVTITTGAAYTPSGSELAAGVDNASTAQPSRQTILINGAERSDLTAYNIGGSNFFQLRELGTALGFEVDFDAASNTAIVRSAQG